MAILEEGWGIRVGNGGSDGEQGIRTARTERWGPLKTVLWASERDPGTDFGPELGFLLRAIWWRLVTSGNTCAIHSCPATVPQSPDFDHLSVAVVFFLLLGFVCLVEGRGHRVSPSLLVCSIIPGKGIDRFPFNRVGGLL